MYRWEAEISARTLEEKLGDLGKITGMEVKKRGAGGIAENIVIEGTAGSKELKGQTQIRNVLGSSSLEIKRKDGKSQSGFAILPSAYISIEKRTGTDGSISFYLYGGGYGHGVGMSQNGAQGMAKEGKDYKTILNFFYEGAEIRESR